MKRFYRSKKDRPLGGIFGGLGELFSIDPILLRLAYILLAVLTGILPCVLAYAVAWAVSSEAPIETASDASGTSTDSP